MKVVHVHINNVSCISQSIDFTTVSFFLFTKLVSKLSGQHSYIMIKNHDHIYNCVIYLEEIYDYKSLQSIHLSKQGQAVTALACIILITPKFFARRRRHGRNDS